MMTDEMLDDDALASHVWELIEASERYSDDQKQDRDRALEYYNGEMKDMVAQRGSTVVSKDLRHIVKKLMPSIMRTFFSSDRVVTYHAQGAEDDDSAEQATEYVNKIVLEECGARTAIYDAILDWATVKTGILKWVAYTNRTSRVYSYSGQPEDAMLGLEGDPEIEIFDVQEKQDEELGLLYSYKLRRIEERVQIKLEAVPRGSFLIYPGSESIETSPLVGERMLLTRSDLVSRGYDKDTVSKIPEHESRDLGDKREREGDDWSESTHSMRKAMQTVLVYEVYTYLDADNDGIAELYRIVVAEGDTSSHDGQKHIMLEAEPVDEAPYGDVVGERDAHQFEGHSLFEDVREIQRARTMLFRETLNSAYAANRQQPVIDRSQADEQGVQALYDPISGRPITLKAGADASKAINWRPSPPVSKSAFDMYLHLDDVLKDRTGVSDQSGGLDPEAFQNMTATTSALISESAVAQAEMIIRSLSTGGIRRAFQGVLKLVVAHADQARTVKLRGEWHKFDPRVWTAEMDCSVNVGLGAGSRERDMSVLQVILGLQREIIANFGADNPLVKPEQLYATLEQIVEASGLPSADPYFTEPDPQEIAAKLEAAKNAPDPEMAKMQGQMQLEQQKAQAQVEREQAQMEADLVTKQADLAMEDRRKAAELERQVLGIQADLMKHRETMDLEYAKLSLPPAVYGDGGRVNV